MQLKDVTWKNIQAFIEGNLNYVTKNGLGEHIKEQAAYRASQCHTCLDDGRCYKCGCKTPPLFFANKKCADGKYPELMNEEDWEMFKTQHKINTDNFAEYYNLFFEQQSEGNSDGTTSSTEANSE